MSESAHAHWKPMRLSLLPYLSACLLYLFICLSFSSFVYRWLSITYLHSTSQKVSSLSSSGSVVFIDPHRNVQGIMMTPAMPSGPCNIYSDEGKKCVCICTCTSWLGIQDETWALWHRHSGVPGRTVILFLGQMSCLFVFCSRPFSWKLATIH